MNFRSSFEEQLGLGGWGVFLPISGSAQDLQEHQITLLMITKGNKSGSWRKSALGLSLRTMGDAHFAHGLSSSGVASVSSHKDCCSKVIQKDDGSKIQGQGRCKGDLGRERGSSGGSLSSHQLAVRDRFHPG